MSIVVLIVASSLNCCAPRIRPTRRCLARAVITKLNEYSPVSPPFLGVVKEHLPRLGEVPPAVHALLQAAIAAICSPFSGRLQRGGFGQLYQPACENKTRVITSVGLNRSGFTALKLRDKLVYNMTALSAAPDA